MYPAAHIDRELRQLLEKQLEAGEKILWAEQPVPHLVFSSFTCWLMIIGIAYIFFMTQLDQLFDFHIAAIITSFNVLWWFVCFMFLVLPPLFCISAPWRERRRMQQTIYAITDKRAICICGRRKLSIKTYPFNTISQIRIKMKPGGNGDVVIVKGVRIKAAPFDDGEGGFFNIGNPQRVGRQLESAIEKMSVHAKTRAEVLPDGDNTDFSRYPAFVVDDTPPKSSITGSREVLIAVLANIGFLLLFLGLPIGLAWLTNTDLAGFVFVLLLLMLLLQIRSVWIARISSRWPTVPGIVSSINIVKDTEMQAYEPKIEFTYQVDGKEYWNDQIDYSQNYTKLSRASAEEISARYPEGLAVTVHYNPHNPYYAVLKAGGEKSGWVALAIFLLLFLGSGIWVVVVWPGLDHNRLKMAWQMIKDITGL